MGRAAVPLFADGLSELPSVIFAAAGTFPVPSRPNLALLLRIPVPLIVGQKIPSNLKESLPS